MSALRRATSLDALWSGEMAGVVIDGRPVLLVRHEDTVCAYEDRCPHLASPLSEGALDDGVLTCGAHEWQFDARTGRGVNPASACLRRYPVRLDGEQIFVGLREDG